MADKRRRSAEGVPVRKRKPKAGAPPAEPAPPLAVAEPEPEQPAPPDTGWLGTGDGEALARRLESSGLFDPQLYRAVYADVPADADAAMHFVAEGDADLRRPNLFFDPLWYVRTHFKRPPEGGALRHYLQAGEQAGHKPCPVFEPRWYAEAYGLDLTRESALAHYLEHRASNAFSPNRFFDIEFYLANNPDVRDAGVDAFQHWFIRGIREGRRGSPLFDADFVRERYLGGDRRKNPFEVFMDVGQGFGWEPVRRADGPSVHREIARNCAAGPMFEALAPPAADTDWKAKVLAFYLPQYHPIAENDAWWGEGFTEWRNVPRGVPRYAGHYQPRVPRDLGFYELAGTGVIKRQIELAARMGVHGFCFYYYNFNGHRLLQKPLDAFVDDPGISFPFSLMWANENWTRRWDGLDKEVLIQQDYREDAVEDLVADFARYMKRPNYIRVAGRPLIFVYRADVIPDCRQTLEIWRETFRADHGLEPLIVMAQAFGSVDPREYGFDGAVEFPPHKLGNHLPWINNEVEILDPAFTGNVRSYEAAVELSLADRPADYPLIKTAFPMWDNDARTQGAGMSFHGSTPEHFERWVEGLCDIARAQPFHGEPLVCINAWNEWCEGAYLEPDCHFGHAYLNALSRALALAHRNVSVRRIVLIGHDAYPFGAQQLLLNIGRTFKQRFGIEIAFVLLGEGTMLAEYQALAPTFVAARPEEMFEELSRHLAGLKEAGFECAITNTVFSGALAGMLADLSFETCSLLHELPTIVRERYGVPLYERIRDNSGTVVFPNAFVESELTAAFGAPSRRAVVRPQGKYKNIRVPPDARAAVREELGLVPFSKLVVNVGYGDIRKGIDVFVAVAARLATTHPNIHFLWVGALDPGVSRWLKRDIEVRGLRNMHFVPFAADVGRYFGAADLFFLSSREDPFPSVVLEALSCGIPVASFDSGGGQVELLRDPALGVLIPFLDVEASARIISAAVYDPAQLAPRRMAQRRALVADRFDFNHYAADLLRLLSPRHRTVSVIVPNYNYGRYLEERLASIFGQTYPVFEIIVLDDASNDDSVARLNAIGPKYRRSLKVQVNSGNSGNVFRQWKAGLDLARGEFIWIAEADDLSGPEFLETLVARFTDAPDAGLAFSDSRAIGPSGEVLYEDYKGYYRENGDVGLDADGAFDGTDFLRRFLGDRNLILNASSVVWRADHLRAVFASLEEEAFAFTCAGDWRLYVESCLLGGQVLYSAQPLNMHRRHGESVTHTIGKRDHLAEIADIHRLVLQEIEPDAQLEQAIRRNEEDLATRWKISARDLAQMRSVA
jgi:glycosyltransferase involved in cell wall biosynthesis